MKPHRVSRTVAKQERHLTFRVHPTKPPERVAWAAAAVEAWNRKEQDSEDSRPR